jgi:hypothetical protein
MSTFRWLSRTALSESESMSWRSRIGEKARFRSSKDHEVLLAAASEQRVLVTFDLKTLWTLARTWVEGGRHHEGIISIDDKTFRQDDIGGIVRAVQKVVAESGDDDWQDRVEFLRRTH